MGPWPPPGRGSPGELLGRRGGPAHGSIATLHFAQCTSWSTGSPQGGFQTEVVCCHSGDRSGCPASPGSNSRHPCLLATSKHRTRTFRHGSRVGLGTRVSQMGDGLNYDPWVLKGLSWGEASKGRSLQVAWGLDPTSHRPCPRALRVCSLHPSRKQADLAVGRVCLHVRGPGPIQGAE